MFESIKNVLRNSLLYDLIRPVLQRRQYRNWIKEGKTGAAPSLETQRVVREYAKKFSIKTLVETGTFRGDMVNAQKNIFDKIFSIELDENLARKAQKRFAGLNHIAIYQGDSIKVLPEIMKQTTGTCLFWLDAHFSGGITAKTDVDVPIMQELKCLFDNSDGDHVTLIDDARNFVGLNDYPTIEELRDFILSKRPDWIFEIKDDIIRTHKKI